MLQSALKRFTVTREQLQYTVLVIWWGNYLGNRNDRLLGSSSAHSATCESSSTLPHSALLLLLQLRQAKVERRNSEAEKKSSEKRGKEKEEEKRKRKKKLASVGFQVWHTLYHWNFFMTAGSDAHHYPTPPEIPQGTRNLHVVWFHCLNRNLWSQIDDNQSRNGDIAMKCHMESGEPTSGCASQKTGKSRRGLTVCFF